MNDPVRVVIAEGGTEAPGMFRFVLEGEGFDVLAETRSVSDLVSAMATHTPDVVVMSEDTGLGAIAYVRAVSDAKVVLISENGAHAGAADAQVEVGSVMSELAATIEELCGGSERALTGSFEKPAWIDKVKKDPRTLREILAKGRSALASRPSVIELQRRSSSRRLHPVERPREHPAAKAEPTKRVGVEAPEVAEVVILPTARNQEVVSVPEAEAIPGEADAIAEPEPQEPAVSLEPEPGAEPVRLSHPHKR